MVKLAKKIGVASTVLSQYLNDKLGKPFTQYINEWRVQYAKQILTQDSNITMDLVAERSGFNSQSTFYNAFKKVEGKTPAQVRNGEP